MNQENLDEEDQGILELVLAASPELKACYQLKEDIRNWLNQDFDRLSAENGLMVWMNRAEASGYQALKSIVKTLRNCKEAILNCFDGRHSNGFAEGVNLKIR